MRKQKLTLAAGLLGCAALVFGLWLFLRNDTAARRAAIGNLQQIDKTKQSWALESELIAHYRFDTDGNDSLGKSPPFVVTNGDLASRGLAMSVVITNSPFTNGVLYVNGQYEPNGQFVHYLSTAPIKEFRYESFTVALDFFPLQKRGRDSFNKVEDKLDGWTRGRYRRFLGWLGFDISFYNARNILTGGYSYRWIGFNRKNGIVNLTLNNQSFVHQFRGAPVKPGRWHNLICSVDLERRKILTIFDGRPLDPITLPPDFKLEVAGSPSDSTDREFTFGNYSNGSMFYGYAAHLKILGRALTETEIAGLYSTFITERPKFPKDEFPWWPVAVLVALGGLGVFLVLRLRRPGGRQSSAVGQMDKAKQSAGSHVP